MRRTDSALDTSELLKEPRNSGHGTARQSLDLRVLGVRTTSGLNKLDFVLVRYRQASPGSSLCIDLLKHSKVEVLPSIRNPILNLLREIQHKPSLAARINAQIGHMFSDGIRAFCQTHHVELMSIDFVGAHTSTLGRFHSHPSPNAGTLPLDWNAIIQTNTGLTTVFDFALLERGAARPQISPVAFIDNLLLHHATKFRVCLNIDDLATLTFIPALAAPGTPGAFSRTCGPGSLLIDYAMRYCTSNEQTCDAEGKFAAEGVINKSIVDRFLKYHDYLVVAPPLSIAREMFGDHEAQRLIDECLFANMSEPDTVATMTRITAQNLLTQYGRLLAMFFPDGAVVDELFICGPGAKNAEIVDFLETHLPQQVVTRPLEDIGVPGDAHEAVCYAHLALEAVLGQTTQTLPATTREEEHTPDEAIRARIICGENWERVLSRVQTFSAGKPLAVTRDVRVSGNISAAVRVLDLQERNTGHEIVRTV
ncbi:hypothetical protein CC86DRAFT_369716 [Ophiobolus disseminans]|uniref:Uncharacterized protein n=1 Tax=Ophiobolus disseminans TaxID=1469910 RepID=A0A6A7A3D5_9PLEO|nr:hypothetical protein CC86DRAFT_369716 [Ophiobolus disseminans]